MEEITEFIRNYNLTTTKTIKEFTPADNGIIDID